VSSVVLLSQTRLSPASVDIRCHPLSCDILLYSTPVGGQKNREFDVVQVSGEEVIKTVMFAILSLRKIVYIVDVSHREYILACAATS
jgi:hypothetical protein